MAVDDTIRDMLERIAREPAARTVETGGDEHDARSTAQLLKLAAQSRAFVATKTIEAVMLIALIERSEALIKSIEEAIERRAGDHYDT